RNSVNGGYLIPLESADRPCERGCTGGEGRIDPASNRLFNVTTGGQGGLKPLGGGAPNLAPGGGFAYARQERFLKACAWLRSVARTRRVPATLWTTDPPPRG